MNKVQHSLVKVYASWVRRVMRIASMWSQLRCTTRSFNVGKHLLSMYYFYAVIFVIVSAACNAHSPNLTGTNPNSDISVLFVGNSLTYYNNLPKLVEKQAKKEGVEISSKILAFPNYAIEDHWNDGQIQKLISSQEYDFVIIQQGPSSQADGRRMLFEYGEKLSTLCSFNGAKLCYLMVWPSLRYYDTFDGVIANYTEAASANNAILLPVGKVWKEYFDSTNNFGYYGPDGFHPSLTGSNVAARVIVEYLFEQHKDPE